MNSIKLKKLSKMNKFLYSNKPPKLKQEENNNLNTPTANKEIKRVIKRLLTKQLLAQMNSTEFYWNFKTES